MNAVLITVGDEILIGQIVDTNSAWMAQQLNLQGIKVQAIYSVSDDREDILDAIHRGFSQADLILMTGGLGPTKDDITKKTLAEYYKVGMSFHGGTWDRIQKLFERWGRNSTEAHRLQCYMPDNATLLYNRLGTAPGMWFDEGGKVLVSMPGVPFEMKAIVKDELLTRLQERFPGKPIAHRTIQTVGEGESRIAARIENFEEQLPKYIKLAYLPSLGRVRLRLTGTHEDEALLNSQLDEKVEELKAIIPEFIFGYDKDTLEEVVGQLLKEQGKTLATAESCTGGYVAHRITSIPGSSAYFKGSVIAYDNAVKTSQLGVSPDTLNNHGAVSEQTVIEMVKGAVKTLETDFAMAISGIAGPSGGTPEKPVGTIWLAAGNEQQIRTRKLQLGKDRMRNIEYTSGQVLNLLRQYLLEN